MGSNTKMGETGFLSCAKSRHAELVTVFSDQGMTEVSAERYGTAEMRISSGEGFRGRCHLSWIVKEESVLSGKAWEGLAENTEVAKRMLSAFRFREVWWLRNRKYMQEGWDMRPGKRAGAVSQGKASVSG